MNPEDEWNEQEKRAFQDLRREIDPGPEFDRRLKQRLRDSGALGESFAKGRGHWVWIQVAAAVMLFAAGLALGTWISPLTPPQVSAQRYMLLLLAGDEPGPSVSADQQVAEYAQWARDLRQQGRSASGERLAPGGSLLPSGEGGTGPLQMQGFFIIEAPTPESALATARTHPHLRYGGRIELRKILSTN